MNKLINKGVKVDLILCDLPYGTTSCLWDTVIPFEKLWERYEKLINKNKPIVLFATEPFKSLLVQSNIKSFKEELIWLKNRNASGMQANQKHIKFHENIVVFSYDNKYTYIPQKWLVEEKEFLTQRKTFPTVMVGNNIYSPMERTRKPDTGERNPISILSCRTPFQPQNNKVYGDDVDLRLHPTQKPLKLCSYLIETFSNEGDLVLDNCMGSGTTGVACKNLNRDFIGIELDEEYFNIAKDRIKNCV